MLLCISKSLIIKEQNLSNMLPDMKTEATLAQKIWKKNTPLIFKCLIISAPHPVFQTVHVGRSISWHKSPLAPIK